MQGNAEYAARELTDLNYPNISNSQCLTLEDPPVLAENEGGAASPLATHARTETSH